MEFLFGHLKDHLQLYYSVPVVLTLMVSPNYMREREETENYILGD